MKLWQWGLVGGTVIGLVVIASGSKTQRRSRVLQLLSILARDLIRSQKECGSVASALAAWILEYGPEWRRLLMLKAAARTRLEEEAEMEKCLMQILSVLSSCRDDPELIALLPELYSLMPPAILERVQKLAPGFLLGV